MNTRRLSPDRASSRKPLLPFAAWALAGLVGISVTESSSAAVFEYVAVLTGSQETPANASTALGGGYAVIDTDANTLTYRICYTGLSAAETAAHIHGPADPGASGGVLNGLSAGSPKAGVWNYLEGQEADILAGRTYFNIHTTAFPGGEIRGQIVSHAALLDGGQENPPNASTATGFGVCVVDKALNQMKYYVSYANLGSAETAAHIHGTANHGNNGGVLLGLPAGNPKVGVWSYTDAQEDAIVAGLTYFNIHSTNFPGGEIRGQIVPIVVPIDGGQEVPPTPSSGAGIGLLAYDTATDNLGYDIRFAGLSSGETAAHMHGWAPAGQNAGVLQALPNGARKLGVWNFGATNQTNLFNDLAYINIHSTNFPGGEIRGQMVGGWTLPVADVRDAGVAGLMRLAQNSPNPFRNVTRIEFHLDEPATAHLSVYDTQGRLVRSLFEGTLQTGAHHVQWDGRDAAGREAASGVYRYVLRTEKGETAGRLTLLR